VLLDEDGSERPLPAKFFGVEVRTNQRILIDTPGAGGYGPPAERDPARLSADLADGKFSSEFLAEHYGYTEPSTSLAPSETNGAPERTTATAPLRRD
jgi:N-methylhydantoinase B